jgi:hypothetical protein
MPAKERLDRFLRNVVEMEKAHHLGDKVTVISLGKQARTDLALSPKLAPQHRTMASTMWDRMGGAFSCLSMHSDAVECYEELVAHYASTGALLLQGRALMLLASKMENIESNSAKSTSDRVQAIYNNVMSVGTELKSKELLSKACGGLSRVLRMDAKMLRVQEVDLKEAFKQV